MNHRIIKHKFLILPAIFVLVFASTTVAFADDIVFGFTPDGVYPVSQSGVSLVSEEITITLTGREAGQVSCEFNFKNNGDAQTVVMGVPARLNEKTDEWTKEEYLNVHNFYVFHEKIEGPIPVELVDTIPNQPMKDDNSNQPKYSKWYTFSIDFEEDEELSAFVMYSIESFPFDNMHNMFITYTLESGALWEGSIESAKVIFDFWGHPMYSVTDASPHDLFRIEDTKLIWERHDFEPDYNIEVIQNNFTFTNNNLFLLSKDEAKNKDEINAIRERIALFEMSPEIIRQDYEKYYDEYNDAINNDDIVKAIFLKSALGLTNDSENQVIADDQVSEYNDDTVPQIGEEATDENAVEASTEETIDASLPDDNASGNPTEDSLKDNPAEEIEESIPHGNNTATLLIVGGSIVIIILLIVIVCLILKTKNTAKS